MNEEIVCRIEIAASRELILVLESGGKSGYQHVYREAAGVYWDEARKGFKSTISTDMPYPEWFAQITRVVRAGLGVHLSLGE